MSVRVLVCDDEAGPRFALAELLADRGHEVLEAPSGAVALALLDRADVVVTDLSMPGMDGLALLRVIRERRPDVPVLLLTARGSERDAVAAMKAGAFDYLTKPFDVDVVSFAVARAAEAAELRVEARRARAERAGARTIVGESAPMKALFGRIERVAPRDVTVLVRGETGTGKELVAELLHALSSRAHGPLVRFNCAALAPELAEAELFGHVRGAFTGASATRPGYFERAHGGTLVLDEVGELPLAMQAKLLRAVQDGEIQPVGASATKHVSVRIVAVTHRDLDAMVAEGTFREDLFFRLSVVELAVPPLRERRSDIPSLARSFAARYAASFGIEGVVLADALLAELADRPWRGNVRELENSIARLVAGSEGGVIERGALGDLALAGNSGAPGAAGAHVSPVSDTPSGASFREKVEAFERGLIEVALADAGGNRAAAARALDLSRVTLLDRMKRLGLS